MTLPRLNSPPHLRYPFIFTIPLYPFVCSCHKCSFLFTDCCTSPIFSIYNNFVKTIICERGILQILLAYFLFIHFSLGFAAFSSLASAFVAYKQMLADFRIEYK